MAAAGRKHATLVANTDTPVPLLGRGLVLVQNHVTATNDLLYVNPATGAAATVGGDDMICIGPGGFRIFSVADKDGSIDLHAISLSAVAISAEIYQTNDAD